MRRYGVVIAVALLALVNAVVLGGAAYNRSGEPDSTVMLTERELPLSSYYGYADRENTGMSLRLSWSRGTAIFAFKQRRDGREAEWFDKAKLEAVGFDCTVPLDDPRALLHYQKLLPRKTFAVLEFEGKAWEAWKEDQQNELAKMEGKIAAGDVSKKQLADARKEYEREARTRSRLFAVDVGNDPLTLWKQYSDGHQFLILPATVRLYYHRPADDADGKKTPPRLEGEIDEILTDTIYVPKDQRALFEKLLRTDGQRMNADYGPYGDRKRGPAYAVTLKVGKRHESWIAGVQPLTAQAVR